MLELRFKVASAVAKAGRGELRVDGWTGGRMDGWTGVSGVDWDVADFERGMTSEPEGPQPTRRNNLQKVPHLTEGPTPSRPQIYD